MMLDEYQSNARKTANLDLRQPNIQIATLGLGIVGEAGEVADTIKKLIGHGHPYDEEKMISELGDCLWYVAMIADYLEIPLSEIARYNNDKLAKRYPNGFESERSINRADG